MPLFARFAAGARRGLSRRTPVPYTAGRMAGSTPARLSRYARQEAFDGLGADGQRRLRAARALLVGVGGLGTWTAELLTRAGIGALRLVDDDVVEPVNLHRQGLYDESDAEAARPKAVAAASRLRAINAQVAIEPVAGRLDAANIAQLAEGADVILDGTDNFGVRLLINDYAVKQRVPWVFAGVVGAEGQVMPVLPGRTACLRCIYDCPPSAAEELRSQALGVVGPAVAAIAAIQAAEAMKILAGRCDHVSGCLTKLDLWRNTVQRIGVAGRARPDCPCCGEGRFEYLDC